MSMIDVGALADWLRIQGLSTGGHISLKPLTGGQSNPTYLVAGSDRRIVLRKRPQGQLLASAHAIDREYRVMEALQGTSVPVPRMLGYCRDPHVLGTEFFVMEYLEGRVYVDQALPGVPPSERGAMYREMSRVISAIHEVDFESVGIGDYGKPGNYFARQIGRWSRQCAAATLPLPSAMHSLMEWLPEHIPTDNETTLVHGDYRLDNLVFHPSDPRIIGVLDWELSTLGHPLADFSAHCMSWRIPAQIWRGIGGLDLQELGIPSEAEYLSLYVNTTGRDPSPHWDFYMAFNLFRLSAILHGIAQRAADGIAAAADALETGRKAAPLAELGWQCAMRYGAR